MLEPYIGLAVGGCIIGTIATSALILYCYKKRQKERVLPISLQPQNQTVTIGIPMTDRDFNPGAEVTTTNSDLTRRGNTRFFSTLRGTTQTYAPTTDLSQSNPVPFSLSSPSTLDGRELYPHYEEAEANRSHSPSSRPFLV